eukprot:8948748-Karenia_brevis.AAC.1
MAQILKWSASLLSGCDVTQSAMALERDGSDSEVKQLLSGAGLALRWSHRRERNRTGPAGSLSEDVTRGGVVALRAFLRHRAWAGYG